MIEAEVRQHLIKCAELRPYLAVYGGEMAVFNQEAPDDLKPGWGGKSQYGRVVFYIDMKDDPERQISGTMGVDVYCESGKQVPEEIEPLVRNLIDGYFFSNQEITIAAQWTSTNYFTEPTKKIIGATLIFNLLAFPNQETTDPDPIALINNWSHNELPAIIGTEEVLVIGKDVLPPAWKPTKDSPAVYWRLSQVNKCSWIPDTYNCSWHTATIGGHIMASERDTEMKIARVIQNTLTIKKRLVFDDMSPLMVDRNIKLASSNDPLRSGQLSVDGTYGVLYIPPPVHTMDNISIK